MKEKKFECVLIGVSAGGMTALQQILPFLPSNFPMPVIIVQHLHPQQGTFHIKFYNSKCAVKVCEAHEKEQIKDGVVYFASANYHLLIEESRNFSLSVDPKVNFSRPSIDVLFESALEAYDKKIIAIILTGANNDGAYGLKQITENGGFTIVQDPNEAEVNAMPKNAIKLCEPTRIMPLVQIREFLLSQV
jgi:two-component system chemotaxis response regulator CheB